MAVQSHFNANSYLRHTDICVGAQVAIRTVNYLPAVGLYNGAIGKVVEIVYRDDPVGPNDKQNCHLPDYVVVDFPHLNLPSTILPWDKNNPTVSHPLTSACFH
jgi:ATP-dependent exoDNAse (exonuclease V) alpha subunit